MVISAGAFINEILTAVKKYVYSKRICAFADLSTAERQDILLQTFMKSWKSFWSEYDISGTLFKRETSHNKASMPFVLRMTPRNKADVQVSLKFIFRNNTSFEVKPIVTATSEELRKKYQEAINKVLDDISLEFSLYYNEKTFLSDWFDVLHENKLSELSSRDALWMYKIYFNGIKYFPVFARMPLQKQINLLQTGCINARTLRDDKRDWHTYAMFTYEALEAANATDVFIAKNEVTRCATLYSKVAHHHKGAISFGDYVYEVVGNKLRTSLHNSEIWNMLCTSSAAFAQV